MQVRYQYAILSFCEDLTSPSASSIPLAIVGVSPPSEAAESGFWFFVSQQKPGEIPAVADDPVAVSILNSLPTLIESQLAQGAREAPNRFLTWLHDRFRNTIHLSSIEEGELTVDPARPTRSIMLELVALFEARVLADTPSGVLNLGVRNLTRNPEPVLAGR